MVPRLPKCWRKPMAQAHAIAQRKTPQGRARAIHAWCEMCKEALSREVPVSKVQPDPVPNLDQSLGAAMRGAVRAANDDDDGARVPATCEGEAR
jgi:hypothetical protein